MYLEMKINEGQSRALICPQPKCRVHADEDKVRALVGEAVREKFNQSLVSSYVENNKYLKWCASTPCCGRAICSTTIEALDCKCHPDCGHAFCFACGEDAHAPATCSMMEHWLRKCRDDSETANWIESNTKKCPKKECQTPIQKTDGCNHMTCNRCRTHFCWLCGQVTGLAHSYENIAGHTCGRYKKVRER
jgi:ariadne-1